jgi:hypothetical protein
VQKLNVGRAGELNELQQAGADHSTTIELVASTNQISAEPKCRHKSDLDLAQKRVPTKLGAGNQIGANSNLGCENRIGTGPSAARSMEMEEKTNRDQAHRRDPK